MKKKIFSFWLFLPFLLALQVSLVPAQTNMGQYEDEAPLQSWNHFGLPTASSLALGMIKIAYPLNNSIALTNPSLLAKLSGFTLTLNGSFNQASLYRFGLVNTGILLSAENLSLSLSALDYAGFSLNVKGWTIGGSVGLLEYYDRPQVNFQKDYQGRAYYTLNYNQSGLIRNFNLAIARKINSRLLIGLGLNLIQGNWERTVNEEWSISQITIRDNRREAYRGFYINGGLTFLITDHLWASFAFRSPFKKKARGESELSYTASLSQTNIKITAQTDNYYHQPLILGGGVSWRISPPLGFLAEVIYYRWSDYKVNFFDEVLPRNFQDTFQIGAGGEYLLTYQLLGVPARIPFRLGFYYDSQPPKTPKTAYLGYTFGMGLHWNHFHLDIGFALAQERGGEQGLSSDKITVTLSYNH